MKPILVLFAALIVLAASAGEADIYRHIDEDGVMHFTNTPTSPKFKLFMRERQRFISNLDNNRYDHIIAAAATAQNLEVPLLKAVIKAESDFNPYAVSQKGAKGLMQIMPQNFPMLNVSNPYDPHQSINAGARYLREMMNRFDGKLALSLAAYNAGPGAVDRHNGIPPYQETENYIERVLRYYHRYKSM